jgi:hypothetical protein
MKGFHEIKKILAILAFTSPLFSNVSGYGVFWEAYFGTRGFDVAYAIDTDLTGKIYIAGVVQKGPIGGYDAFVASFDSSGVLRWEAFWGTENFDAAYALHVDWLGNIYIAGRTGLGPFGGDDAFVASFDSSGVLRWEAFWGTADYDRAYGIAADLFGNVYIVGSIGYKPGPFDAFVASFDSSGVLRWEAFWGTEKGYEYGIAVDVDWLGNVYVAGRIGQGEVHGMPFDAFVASFDSSGVLRWEAYWGRQICDWATGVVVDAHGNVYITGPTWTALTQLPEIFVVSFNASGVFRWEALWGTLNVYERSYAIDADLYGNVYVTGYTRLGPFGGYDAVILSFDSSGDFRWGTYWGTENDDQALGVTVDWDGKVYITGYTSSGPYGWYDAFIVAYYMPHTRLAFVLL